MNPEFAIRGVGLLLAVLASMAVAVFGMWLLVKGLGLLFTGTGKLFSAVGRFVTHVFTCLKGIVVESLRYVGSLITAVVLVPLVLGNIALGRWSAATHFGRATGSELAQAVSSLYRATIGFPLRLVGLGALVAGFEERIPEVIAGAPGADRPKGGAGAFEGYEVVGSLPPGGSGAKLYLADLGEDKRAQLARAGLRAPERVVIKSFSLDDGSTLPQIVRESRALEAARELGLVLEHELTPTRFHYVMPYVPGEHLGEVGRGLHAASGPEGLKDSGLRAALGYASGLLGILARFHRAGLWHKDIKPNNVIVAGDRVELVDLGLVTPLASAMTLTTHGTEYYRDPELVRLAMQGVRVQDVDGVKFDLYSAGAVLYNLIENEFPAHGSLSKITRRCPDALRWIIRRSMADLRSRYASADEMLADLRVLLAAPDPFAVKPAQLPSMGGRPVEFADAPEDGFAADGLPPNSFSAPPRADAGAERPVGPPPHRRRRRTTTPMGALGFVGVTVAVLALPAALALMFGAVQDRGTVVRSARVERVASTTPAPAPRGFAGTTAAVDGLFGPDARWRFGDWPSQPPVPPRLVLDPASEALLGALPEPPPTVRAALGQARPPVDRAWIDDAEGWIDRADAWIDHRVELADRTGRESLDGGLDALEDWVDELDGWLAELDGALEGQAPAARFGLAGSTAHTVAGAPDAPAPAGPDRAGSVAAEPHLRALLLASGRGALARTTRQEFESGLAERSGWELVSDLVDPGAGRSQETFELLSRALKIASMSPIDDAEVNRELGLELLERYDLDAILRYEWDLESDRPRIHVIHGPGGEWIEGALVENLTVAAR